MSWRNSITQVQKPRVLIQKQSQWKQSIQPVVNHGKDFNFDENVEKINALIKGYINSIKPQLKGEQGNAGKVSVGDNGRDGSTWFFSEDAPDQKGKDGDFCLCENGDVYQKSSSEWVKRLSLKGKDAKTQYIGGGVTEDRVNQLIAANAGGGGGGTATNIVSTTVNMTVTDETHVVVKGASAVTISLKAIATASEPVSISNKSSENCTVDIDGGGTISDVVDDTALIIVPGNTYIFLPETGVAYHVT
jgi:hypothetical protein